MVEQRRPMVLIADDDPKIVSVLARLLNRAGISFISDSTSEHVLELARKHLPNLVILDVRQQVDGRDLLSTLKADPTTRHIPVLMLSGADDEFTRRNCIELGAVDFCSKPFDPLLIRKIARLSGMAEPQVQALKAAIAPA